MILQPGATFLHIRGDLAALERTQGIGWENNEQTKFGTWCENKRATSHRGYSELLQGHWGNGA